jgi:peroxiredoxin
MMLSFKLMTPADASGADPKAYVARNRAAVPVWAKRLVLSVAAALLAACAGQTAPESTFVLLDGSKLTTQGLKGRVALVNFWATSCVTCVAEMPELVKTHNKFQARGFETVAVAMQSDPPSYVVHFAQTRQLPFKVAIDNTGAVAKTWGNVAITPTTFLLNRQGEIVKTFVGPPDFAALNAQINQLLGAQ